MSSYSSCSEMIWETHEEESKYISDDYDHSTTRTDLFYTVNRVPGKGVAESSFECFEFGCECRNSQCTKQNNCSCLKYGVNYRLTDEGLVLNEDKLGDSPVFECNNRCCCFQDVKNLFRNEKLNIVKSPQLCPNRNVQFGPIDCLEIFQAGPKGLGLKTNRKIPSGTFICEYAGEVISLEEARKRHEERSRRNEMNFIFILKEHSGNEVCHVTCVDPTHIGNIGRYINHSCQPNSKVVPVRVFDGIPWLCVFAIRDIEKDEEICYNYSGHGFEDGCGDGVKGKRKLCFCGAQDCRKYLPFHVKI